MEDHTPALSLAAAPRPFRRVVAVIDGPNPSFDYYFASRLEGFGPGEAPEIVMADRRRPFDTSEAALDGCLLLFCRYLSPAWLLRAQGGRPAAVGLFLDDDMAALQASDALALRFRAKLRRLGTARWEGLSRSLTTLLVSTSALAERFAAASPIVLSPLAGRCDLERQARLDAAPPVRLAFHATASHIAEHRWLAPVIAELLAREPAVEAEVVASGAAARLWRAVPGVRVAPHRDWPAYRSTTASSGFDLMLAPLLPSPANAARAPTKRIDAARCGAALIVSDAQIYGVCAEERTLGMAQPLDPAAWVSALQALIRDRAGRFRLAEMNHARLAKERAQAQPLFRRDTAGWSLAESVRPPSALPGEA